MKPTVLLCWGYNRKNWIEFFEALNNDFNFVYLFYMYPSDEREVYTTNRRIFYTEFSSAKKLLEEIRPTKVVFMGLDGLLAIALNLQCRRMGIPTYFMSHGSATLSLDDYRDFRLSERNLLKESLTHKLGSWLFTFKFLLKALGLKYLHVLPLLIRFQFYLLKMHPILALEKNKTPIRLPSKYIVFSEEDVKFYMTVDNCNINDIIVLGNIEIGVVIKMAEENGINDKGYLLYIETPLSKIEGHEFDINKLTIEENNALLVSMNGYALQHGLKLVIKLHPYSFQNTFFIQHPNIIYKKNDEKESLILDAHAIIFYNSSLAIPSLYFKPCCMFIIDQPDEFQSIIAGLKVCTVVDYRKIIEDKGNISFFVPGETAKQAYIDKYIGAGIDGKGLERLRDTLLI